VEQESHLLDLYEKVIMDAGEISEGMARQALQALVGSDVYDWEQMYDPETEQIWFYSASRDENRWDLPPRDSGRLIKAAKLLRGELDDPELVALFAQSSQTQSRGRQEEKMSAPESEPGVERGGEEEEEEEEEEAKKEEESGLGFSVVAAGKGHVTIAADETTVLKALAGLRTGGFGGGREAKLQPSENTTTDATAAGLAPGVTTTTTPSFPSNGLASGVSSSLSASTSLSRSPSPSPRAKSPRYFGPLRTTYTSQGAAAAAAVSPVTASFSSSSSSSSWTQSTRSRRASTFGGKIDRLGGHGSLYKEAYRDCTFAGPKSHAGARDRAKSPRTQERAHSPRQITTSAHRPRHTSVALLGNLDLSAIDLTNNAALTRLGDSGLSEAQVLREQMELQDKRRQFETDFDSARSTDTGARIGASGEKRIRADTTSALKRSQLRVVAEKLGLHAEDVDPGSEWRLCVAPTRTSIKQELKAEECLFFANTRTKVRQWRRPRGHKFALSDKAARLNLFG
jgi:hypothetical protein